MAELKAILFDNDGTIVDTHDLLLATFQHTVRTVLGREIPEEVLMAKVGLPLEVQMWDYTDDPAVHEELLAEFRRHNAILHDDMVSLFDGVAETLAALDAAGFKLGVVTSKRHAAAQHGLEILGVMDRFSCLVGADDFPEHKPQPGPVAHGAELLGVSPDECIYVGDSPFDMQAGSGAGCATVAALWGMFSEEVLREQNPTYVCSGFADVLSVEPVAARLA